MSFPIFDAYVRGYEDHLLDLQLLSAHAGFWSGYYSRAKKPKKLESVLKSILKRSSRSGKSSSHADDVDVEGFLARERAFKERMKESSIERK